MKPAILCIDDEIDNLDALERLLRREYRVLKATSGAEALEILSKEPITVIICDQRMPKMTGVQFFEKAVQIRPEAIRILLTGYSDLESVIAAINEGQIYRYLSKPWDSNDLLQTLSRAVERYQMSEALKEKNARLEKALEELKSLDEAKNRFMVLVNHELKTPLTGIISFLDLLKETTLDEEQKLYTDRIDQNAQRLNRMIADVLELISAQTGQTPISLESKTTRELFTTAIEGFRESAQLKGIHFLEDNNDIPVEADSRLVANVLKRLTDNAVKFADENSTIRFQTQPTEDGQVELLIENEGKPINKEVIERILKPFDLDENIMNHSKGFGLGLSVSDALLKRLDSKLDIQSTEKGVQVRFLLPAPRPTDIEQ